MLSCLGVYIDKNLIKYAKLRKVKDSFKIEAFNVEVFEDLEASLKKIINETDSNKCPICTNISNELYNYFDVFSMLEKKDITKSLNIEFEMLCHEKNYDIKSLESRYIIMENQENFEKYKSMYISTNKNELNKRIDMLSNYKLYSMTPVSTSITNLIEYDGTENVAIINMENETQITTIIDGQIRRVNILNKNLEEAVKIINKVELSWKKSYDVFKNITIYGREGVQSLDESENEYLDIVMPTIYQIANETKKVLGSFKEKIDTVYITGMGATINNIDLYFQDFLKNTRCEILKPFFVDTTSLKVATKEYIEVNSAIALALEGLGYANKDLNFAPVSKLDNLENITKEDFNLKKMFSEAINIQEKTIIRIMYAFIIALVVFGVFGNVLVKKLNDQKVTINRSLATSSAQITNMKTELSQIESHTNAYAAIINGVDSKDKTTLTNQSNRIISKDAIPNLLNKIMFIIPQEVQINSIVNTESKHIVIEATSKKYEQLAYFVAYIKEDGILQSVQSEYENDSESSNFKITIEGDLP